MLETILVVGLLAFVSYMVARSFVRTLTGKTTGKNLGCGCGGDVCQGCTEEDPAEEHPQQGDVPSGRRMEKPGGEGAAGLRTQGEGRKENGRR